jgi:hypothetical protein
MKCAPRRMQPRLFCGSKFRIANARRPIKPSVNPLRALLDVFVNTFGITQPKPETEVRDGRFIAIMLAAVLVLLVAVAWLLRASFTR